MKKISLVLVAVVLGFTLFLTGCGKKNENLIRVNEVTHSVFYAPLYIAINKGYFAEEGLEIELTNGGGADKSMTEGFVDFPLTIDEVSVSIALMETGARHYKASLRGKDVDVNAVASQFGGGGHKLASGCVVHGDLEEVIDRLKYAVYQNL